MKFPCMLLLVTTTELLSSPLGITAFAPATSLVSKNKIRQSKGGGSLVRMAMENPPALPPPQSDLPVIQRSSGNSAPVDIRYSDFLKLVNADRVEKVAFSADGTQMLGVDVEGARVKIEALPDDPDLLTELTKHKVDVAIMPVQPEASGLVQMVQGLFFPALLLAGLFFLFRRPGGVGGANNPMGFGKSKAQIQLIPDTGVTFDDVAGCDGAKMELEEVVDFLKQPEAYTKNGCKIPRGVILDGPPGTGKTLLAKAVAGEAGVPFISISGSEFVEMFVGVGASRVRDIFAQAKKNAPCIIFIDEIDAVGRQRGAGYAGGNDEREQTVNQILVELDGFDGNPGVITIAATNRIDILDVALLRPGRFDRKITVALPDFKGRARILGVHSRGKPLEPDVDLEAIARRTPGFSGAELENLMNEAAITAARKNKLTIGWEEIDSAADRVMVGLEKKGGNPQLKQKELIAYHEAGHAIVGALVPDYDQVQKISIIPHSNGSGGMTFFSPQESRLESGMYSKQYLESQLAVALGGRLAEEIIYGEDMVTTGASNDIEQVANIAKRMVKEWGMSNKIGLVALSEGQRPSFLGMRMIRRPTHWGNKIMYVVEEEVERLVNNSYLLAKKILNDNRELLDHLTRVLMEQEVVSAEEFQMMLVEFKARTIGFDILSKEKNREKLPFQKLPEAL
jgi:cell division protease FtsH